MAGQAINPATGSAVVQGRDVRLIFSVALRCSLSYRPCGNLWTITFQPGLAPRTPQRFLSSVPALRPPLLSAVPLRNTDGVSAVRLVLSLLADLLGPYRVVLRLRLSPLEPSTSTRQGLYRRPQSLSLRQRSGARHHPFDDLHICESVRHPANVPALLLLPIVVLLARAHPGFAIAFSVSLWACVQPLDRSSRQNGGRGQW